LTSFEEVVQSHFPGASRMEPFVRRAAAGLIQDYGFTPANTLACVGVCRDEICRSLTEEIEAMWGKSFDFSSLAGVLTLGKTGLSAAQSHAPVVAGRQRYVFFLFAHIGISAGGDLGVTQRAGQETPTAACGALVALRDDLHGGGRHMQVEWEDPEMSLLRLRMKRVRELDPKPDLMALTKATHRATVQDFEELMSSSLNRSSEDFALVAGVEIHGPEGENWIWVGDSYVVIDGRRSEIWF
jgi:hypothetical protein